MNHTRKCPNTIEIPASKRKPLALTFILILFIIVNVYASTTFSMSNNKLHITFILIAVICIIFCLIKLFNEKPAFVISDQGIMDNSPRTGLGFASWADITNVKKLRIERLGVVSYFIIINTSAPSSYMKISPQLTDFTIDELEKLIKDRHLQARQKELKKLANVQKKEARKTKQGQRSATKPRSQKEITKNGKKTHSPMDAKRAKWRKEQNNIIEAMKADRTLLQASMIPMTIDEFKAKALPFLKIGDFSSAKQIMQEYRAGNPGVPAEDIIDWCLHNNWDYNETLQLQWELAREKRIDEEIAQSASEEQQWEPEVVKMLEKTETDKELLKKAEEYIRKENEYIENKKTEKNKRKSEWKKEVENILNRREIKYLVHFTHISNLKNILKWGISSVNYLKEKNIPYQENDKSRYDNNLSYTSTSVSFPNSKLFYKFRRSSPNDKYAVILFDAKILLDKGYGNVLFHVYNAAAIKHHQLNGTDSAEAFEEMFDSEIQVGDDTIFRRIAKDEHPTSSQAEIQIEGRISPKYFMAVIFENEKDKNACANIKSNASFFVNKYYFGRRGDNQ